ncbi:MAG: hypothetical protein HY392_03910 [Candidatus Diapherotrites archaeon]|nr:hypothetical protein [Candidatus Diapherotrites archaeon]
MVNPRRHPVNRRRKQVGRINILGEEEQSYVSMGLQDFLRLKIKPSRVFVRNRRLFDEEVGLGEILAHPERYQDHRIVFFDRRLGSDRRISSGRRVTDKK